MPMNPDTLAKVQAILAQLDEQLQESKEHNRRRASRVTARFPLRVILLSGNAPVPLDVFSRNISASGISFLTRRLFHDEEHIAVSIRIPGRGGKLVFSRTTFGRYLREGVHEVGAEFLECIPDPSGAVRIPRAWILAATAKHEPLMANEPPRKKNPAKAPSARAAAKPPVAPPPEPVEAPAPAEEAAA